MIKPHSDVQWTTLVRYARVVSKGLGFALRCSLSSECEFNAPLTTRQRDACAGLLQSMRSTDRDNTPITASWDGDSITDDTSTDSHQNDDADEDEINEDDIDQLNTLFQERVSIEPLPLGTPNAPESRKTYLCPVVQPALTELLVSLATHVPLTAADGKWYNILLPFIVLASIRKQGEFLPASQITQVIVAVLFTLRLTMFNVMDTYITANPTERYEAYACCFQRGH